MEKFIDSLDISVLQSANSDEINSLVEYIITKSGRCLDDYCVMNIPIDKAAEVAFASPSVCEDYFEINGIPPEVVIKHFDVKSLAYYLAFEAPEIGTELLNELEFYHSKGRI